jgi:hypothetical protein
LSAIQEFRSALKEALKPYGLGLVLWRGSHRASPHLLQIDTQPRITVLYVKESNSPRGFWGITKNQFDRLNGADISWFVVLLRNTAERGYLLRGSEVSCLVRDGTFELSGDGDYKVNEPTDLSPSQAFAGIPELLGRLL